MLRCSAEAFARCPTRHLCERREDATYAEGSECDLFNRQVGQRPMTNREKLLSMSDEDLADFLMDVSQGNITVDVCNSRYCNPDRCPNDCGPAIVKWLNAPTEVPNGK